MKNKNLEDNLILKLTFEFSLEVIEFCQELEFNKKYLLAKQLFRSGTSIGANICEAQNAESRSDFIHKFKISAKETDETKYWIMICEFAKDYPRPINLIEKLEVIEKIITKIISTSKNSSTKFKNN